jgi:ferredoxin
VIRICFVSADGSIRRDVLSDAGVSLLEAGQADGQPLEGTCEGQMACSTCHVIVDPDWFSQLKPPSEEEEDLLDLAAGATRTSRLACQIMLEEEFDGIVVRIPAESRNMQGH